MTTTGLIIDRDATARRRVTPADRPPHQPNPGDQE